MKRSIAHSALGALAALSLVGCTSHSGFHQTSNSWSVRSIELDDSLQSDAPASYFLGAGDELGSAIFHQELAHQYALAAEAHGQSTSTQTVRFIDHGH